MPTPRSSTALRELPLTVWPTAQHVARTQRRGRYIPESTAHPAKMLPAIAAHAITAFTTPGDHVLDPMCGIGTTLVEAVHQGRDALGVEYEQRWVDVTQANLALAAQSGATGTGHVLHGDARHTLTRLAGAHTARVGLLVTSPPYGASLHGQITTASGGVRKRDYRYSHDRGNLAHRSLPTLLRGFTDILTTALPLLKPGGIVAITTRPFRHDGTLIDFPSLTLDAAINAGLEPIQRCIALLAGVRDGRLIPRTSFFQLDYIRKLRAHGIPAHAIAHEDVLILRRPPFPGSSVTPQGSEHYPAARPRPLSFVDTPSELVAAAVGSEPQGWAA
ncbi:TRM11 family SAM-dependent methyltransferase [Saccharopolyspora spinosa]